MRTDIAAITSRIEARRIDTRRSTGIKGEEEAARFLSR